MKQVTGVYEDGKWRGVFMLLTGAIFLMGTSGITLAGRSAWMLVSLLPIYWIGVMAYQRYKEDGRLTRRFFSIAVFAVLPFAYIAAPLLGYSTSGLWPLGVIVVGISVLLFGSRK